MAMANALGDRYSALFDNYSRRSDITARVADVISSRRKILREDARYFLLVNFDHMIIRAMSEPIAGRNGLALSPFDNPKNVARMAEQCLSFIIDKLAKSHSDREPISANDVIRLIAKESAAISGIIAWWNG